MDSGVARRPLADLRKYARELSGRLDPTANALDAIMESVRAEPKRVVFAEGEEEKIVRAAVAFRNAGYGTPVLIGREERVRATMTTLGLGECRGHRDPQRPAVARQPPTTPSSSTRACSGAASWCATASAWSTRTATSSPPAWWRPAMPTRWSRGSRVRPRSASNDIALRRSTRRRRDRVRADADGRRARGATIFVADTLMHFRPTAEQMADIAIGAAAAARRLGHEPRVALLSHSTFGNQMHAHRQHDARGGGRCSTRAASTSNTTAR